MAIPVICGLSEIAAQYDGFVLDIWGVVHQGGPAYPDVIDCLAQLHALDRPAVFLSNAPRRAGQIERLLASKGVPPALHRGVVSSGEIARLSLEARQDPALLALGPRYFYIGADSDDDLLDGLPYRRVDDPGAADFVLAIGLDDLRPTVENHEPVLLTAARRRLPMLCVNPDITVVRLGARELCAGALAKRYAVLGGTVHYFGKPYPSAYPPALAKLGLSPGRRVLAIGDGLETDIRGARAAGLSALFVTGGIFADALGIDPLIPPPSAVLDAACRDPATMPDAAIAMLRW